jgi:nitrile hydratase
MTKYEGFNYDSDREIYSAARVRALESLLIEKGIISSETVNKVLNYFETDSLVCSPCQTERYGRHE